MTTTLSPELLRACLSVYPRLAFVDLETTGSRCGTDRITEVAIIQVDEDGVREWSSLVQPGIPIPPFIQSLTGIDDQMVAEAPTFDRLAADIHARLQDRVFIAHNVGFDRGFLQQQLQEAGFDFRPAAACTVQLSRRLYPEQDRHNLDSLIARHGLRVSGRHRALDDTRLIWQFWQIVCRDFSPVQLAAALPAPRPRPPAVAPLQLDATLPDGHGVWLLHGEDDTLLQVGRATRLRQQLMTLLRTDQGLTPGTRLSAQVRRIDWLATEGALGAQLQEIVLVKARQPRHHRLPQHRDLPAPAAWPYPGPIGVREGQHSLHVLDDWCYLGTARGDAEIWPLLALPRRFDHDIHLLLLKRLPRLPKRSLMLLGSQLDFNAPAA
ncbi:3'-5' exonuclease family protein [Eleftheria terrae]|uniref:3'-5' exonuclease family protein n=1 Tax=Eleftheria terrae TaxID=1597781 RepID=UPI00263B6A97|nr:3'-5' exonuclease family protein [Eleftheria terrae]WKB54624.1 exonuclease domain-containing protein [Eleftheria terrae]